MTYDERVSNIIEKLKQYKEKHPTLTLEDIANSTGLSPSTISRMFTNEDDAHSFRADSIQAIAEFLLEDENDDTGLAIYRYNESYIKELEDKLHAEKDKYERKLERERNQYNEIISLLNKQIESLSKQVAVKDERMDRLFTGLEKRGELYESLHKKYDELNQQHYEVMAQLVANKDLINKVLEKEDGKG